MGRLGRTKYVHIGDGITPQSYRVNDYELDLLEAIREYEKMDSQSEVLRFVLREAATIRGLHPIKNWEGNQED